MRLKDKTIVFNSKRSAARAFADLETVYLLRMLPKTRDQVLEMEDAELAGMARDAVKKLEATHALQRK